MNDNGLDIDPRTEAEAQLWFSKHMSGELKVDPSLKAEFEAWLAASPEHGVMFGRVENLFRDSASLKLSGEFGFAPQAPVAVDKGAPWVKWGVAAAVVIAVLFIIVGNHPLQIKQKSPNPQAVAFAPLATGRGEIRTFTLSDGSTATLDTDSKIEVSMTSDSRHLRLAQGRARVTVAEDVRPLTVEAGSGEVTTKNATVDIGYMDGERVGVQLIRGDAQLRPAPQFASYIYPPRALALGNPLTFRTNDFQITALPSTDVEQEWPSGWAEFKSIRLDALIVKANRYSKRPIRIEGADAAALKVSGRFKIDDTKGFVRSICELFDLTSRDGIDGITIRKR